MLIINQLGDDIVNREVNMLTLGISLAGDDRLTSGDVKCLVYEVNTLRPLP